MRSSDTSYLSGDSFWGESDSGTERIHPLTYVQVEADRHEEGKDLGRMSAFCSNTITPHYSLDAIR